MLKAEIDVLEKAGRHPNVVELYDIFETRDELMLVVELVQGGELFEHLVDNGAYSETVARHHIRMIAKVGDVALKLLIVIFMFLFTQNIFVSGN